MGSKRGSVFTITVFLQLLGHSDAEQTGVTMISVSNVVYESSSGSFDCSETASHKPATVLRWEHNGYPLYPNSHVRISPRDTYHKLLIRSVEKSDGGRYECVAEINGLVYRANQTLTVLANRQRQEPKTTVVKAVLGTSVTLICGDHHSDAVYYQSVSWSRNGNVISRQRRGNGSDQFVISNVSWTDNATYTCSFYVGDRTTKFRYFHLVVSEPEPPSTAYATSLANPYIFNLSRNKTDEHSDGTGECLWVMAATGIAAMLSAIGMVAAIYIRKKRNRAVRRNVLNGPKHTVPEGPSDGTVRVG